MTPFGPGCVGVHPASKGLAVVAARASAVTFTLKSSPKRLSTKPVVASSIASEPISFMTFEGSIIWSMSFMCTAKLEELDPFSSRTLRHAAPISEPNVRYLCWSNEVRAPDKWETMSTPLATRWPQTKLMLPRFALALSKASFESPVMQLWMSWCSKPNMLVKVDASFIAVMRASSTVVTAASVLSRSGDASASIPGAGAAG
mmetsp:Transcript_66841/g.186615  ORF Transcript_66841/g.186615 Transcript_66841/m.186615 type:complete len:202 (+) Transcript_66841:755-1360(+)